MTTTTTILAAGVTVAVSDTVTLEAGESATIGYFTDTPKTDTDIQFEIVKVTPGADTVVGYLSSENRATQIYGPVSVYVNRPAMAVAYGIFKEV